ncbi:MAG: hypothetical protein F4X72_05895 [Dehalococcoidia bacterium]|nr:hypothetical protein [Dehalococcoidia bacterium]
MHETERDANLNVYARHEGEIAALKYTLHRVLCTLWDALDDVDHDPDSFPNMVKNSKYPHDENNQKAFVEGYSSTIKELYKLE